MKLPLICIIAAGLFFTAHAAPLKAVRCAASPVIDGKLDDACWKDALKFTKFKVMNKSDAAIPAEVRLLYDDKALYVGYRLDIPNGCTIRRNAQPGADSIAIYGDDCVELMIDPSATATRYFHFITNANGAVSSWLRDQGGAFGEPYPCAVNVKAYVTPEYWSCEFRIPYSSLDIQQDDALWGFNFAHGARVPHFQDASITASGTYHSASEFCKVSGFDFAKDRFAWELSSPKIVTHKSGNKLTADVCVTLANRSEKKQKALFNLVMMGTTPDGASAGVGGSSINVEIPPGNRRELQFPAVQIDRTGDFRCILSVTDPETRYLLKRITYRRQISYAPFTVKISEPCYRDMIFVSQKLKNVSWNFSTSLSAAELNGAEITTGVCTPDGNILYAVRAADIGQTFTCPVDKLPEGKLQVFVKAEKAGKVLGDVSRQLRKLPYKKGEVWRDRHGIWHVDEKPFFLIGSWGSHFYPGFNATVGDYRRPGVLRLERECVYAPRFIELTQVPSISPEDQKYLAGVYRKLGEIPNLFAHYIVDEPELSGCTVMAISQHAAAARDADPWHPLMISNDTVKGMEDFADCAEINGLHPYPPPRKDIPRNEFQRIVMFMDQSMAINKTLEHPQTIAFLQQGFNYGDCGNAGTCVPSYDETRISYLLSLAMGGNAVMFFNYCAEHYYEFSVGHPDIALELATLTPAMTVPDETGNGIACDNPKIRFRVKKVDGEYWILAGSTVKEPQQAKFIIPKLENRKIHVFREGRALNADCGTFSDSFKNFDARVYTTDSRTFGLRPVAEVEAEIRRLNESRRKTGNLAFQMYEGDSMKFYASSNKGRHPDSGLWHVSDGITGGMLAENGCGYKGKLGWIDNTPGKTPDWLVMEFPETVTIGRIVVYPAEGTLKDYEVQLEADGKFITVGSVKNLPTKWDEHQEFIFDPVKTRRIRLWITANNHNENGKARTKVHEIEVYRE